MKYYCGMCGKEIDELKSGEINIEKDGEIVDTHTVIGCERCVGIYDGKTKKESQIARISKYCNLTGKKWHFVVELEREDAIIAIGMAKSGRLFD